jgi:hypothetical protein
MPGISHGRHLTFLVRHSTQAFRGCSACVRCMTSVPRFILSAESEMRSYGISCTLLVREQLHAQRRRVAEHWRRRTKQSCWKLVPSLYKKRSRAPSLAGRHDRHWSRKYDHVPITSQTGLVSRRPELKIAIPPILKTCSSVPTTREELRIKSQAEG